MGTNHRHLLSVSLVSAFAACSSGADRAPEFAPAPAGETAAAAEAGLDVAVQDAISQTWADASGQVRSATFRFTYRTRSTHAVLAAECVRTRWQDAVDGTLRVLQRSDLATEQGRKNCDRDLQAQLTEALFPCSAGEPLATVSEIVWAKPSGK
jgi:hypothetical protein